MKAWTIAKRSNFNSHTESQELPSRALELSEVSTPPSPLKGEVLIKIKSSSINFNGVWSCQRRPKDPFSLLADHIRRNPNDKHHELDYFIPGSDACAEVVQVGSGVSQFKEGDTVVAHCAVICEEDLGMPDPMLSKSQSIWGYETNYGSFAEYSLVKSSQLIAKPVGIDYLTAGSCLLTLGTAYRMLISENGAQLKRGESCLIWGASGGLGVFAIQLCISIGAIPVCIVSTEEKADYCRKLGATYVLVADREVQKNFVDKAGQPVFLNWRQFSKKLHGLIGEERVDCVFEHVGRDVFSLSVFLLRRGGRLVTCAATSGYDCVVDVRFVWMEMKRIIGSHFCNSLEAKEALSMLSLGAVKHESSKIIQFEDIPAGLDHLALRLATGKVAVNY